MISLKKHIESHGEEPSETAGRAWQGLLAAVGRHLASAVPGVARDLGGNLAKLADRFRSDSAPASVLTLQRDVDSELALWATAVQEHLRSKAAEAREIMLAMAGTAQSLTSRDKRYAARFRDMKSRMEGIADLDDLSVVRRSLMSAAQELNSDIQNMEAEGQLTIAGLEGKLQDYQKQLAESERRECSDALTGLMNRRGVELEIEKNRAERRHFCVVVLDLNSFKPVNDTYGHAAGDEVLKQFAGELRAQFPAGDVLGRWGGDEFIVVKRGDMASARTCVEGVRKWAFGAYKIKTAKGVCSVPVSASIGIAAWNMEEGITQLLGRADESMYLEKRSGADRRTGS
jgi:diguanylate cyclase (GGDEF)-like protein